MRILIQVWIADKSNTLQRMERAQIGLSTKVGTLHEDSPKRLKELD